MSGSSQQSKIERILNIYGVGYSTSCQTGVNRSYHEQTDPEYMSEYLLISSKTGAMMVKTLTHVVQCGSIGEQFALDEHVVQVSCGLKHSLFVTNHRRVFCCGDNSKGCCALDRAISKVEQVTLIPELSDCNIVETKCGSRHSFFISEGYESVYAAGHNKLNECGLPKSTTLYNIYGVRKLGDIEGKRLKYVAPGGFYTVFVTVDNCVYVSGCLGQGHESKSAIVPTRVDHTDLNGLKVIKSVECGKWHTIVIVQDGTAYAWGSNIHGQCGLNSTSDQRIESPTLVSGIPEYEKVAEVRCGSYFTVFRSESNRFYGCGENFHGALGLLHYSYPTVAQIPLSIGTVLNFSCGVDLTVFTTKEGGVYVFGGRRSVPYIGNSQSKLEYEICLPWKLSQDTSHCELHTTCSKVGYHTFLYSVPAVHSIFFSRLFATQRKRLLCDVAIVTNIS